MDSKIEKLEIKINKNLKKYWNFDKLKDKQMEVILNFLQKKDVVALLPTGYGKSMCYLIPPLVKKKTIFIISPLISLMEDQKEKLNELKLPVACLHGNNPSKDREIYDIIDGNIKIVYMSPEYLVNGEGMELANTLKENKQLGFLAVDESHCISVWGHDFRNSYLKIKNFREKFPKIPIMALTATATERVTNEIVQLLNLRDPVLVKAKFDRPNLYLKCIELEKDNQDYKFKQLKPWLLKYRNSKIIIYMNSRKACDDLAELLNSKNLELNQPSNCVISYHAGLSKGYRNKIQNSFSSGEINIIISTVAFGMGIDQIVRCVLIFGAPSSIEDYYQQIGRAGRDGEPAETVLFFQYKNIAISKHMNKRKGEFNKEVLSHKSNCLDTMAKYFYTPTCRRRYILQYFGEIPKFFCCHNCDNCCDEELTDYTEKMYKCVVLNKKIDKIFTTKEVNMLLKNKIIDFYNNFNKDIINWKKILEINKKTLKNMPKKYRILLK